MCFATRLDWLELEIVPIFRSFMFDKNLEILIFQIFRFLSFEGMKTYQQEQGSPILKSKWGKYTLVLGKFRIFVIFIFN